ncbi:hypothetical protein GQ44DRAFT_712747 [Phaeosphaeriaceae sp. PMI808]|nr:hypothetical protein GQ44DRAFT_712747 [Phaeosphaeriaceae sp. PMI808]
MKNVNEHYNVSLKPTSFQKACAKLSRRFSKVFCFWRKPVVDAEILLDEQSSNVLKQNKHPWGVSHGFYGMMGGFAIDTSGHEDQFLPLLMNV